MNDFSDISAAESLAHQADENRLTAEIYDEFFDALDILYIKGNLSGRLKFIESWPDAGQLLFGEELIGFDRDGVSDLERRSVLEDEAEERRLEMLEIVETLEKKSVEKSVLQIEYVEALVKRFGRDLALLMYAPKIVNRFIAPPPEPELNVGEDGEAGKNTEAVSNDPLKASQKDVEALANEIVPDAPMKGAPSASNPVVDIPEPPKKREKAAQAEIPDPFAEAPVPAPIVPDIDENMDAVEPISLEPPPQKPVPEDIQEEAAQHNPALKTPSEPSVAPLPEEPENSFLGRSPYDREDTIPEPAMPPAQPAAPPAPTAPPQQPMPPQTPSSDPVRQDSSGTGSHKAIDDLQPIASQKMTFMPAKSPEAQAKADKPIVPVIGGNKDKPQDS